MPEFEITYTLTERTRRRVLIEAETQKEAIELVESYEFDNSEAEEIESLEWSIDDIEGGEP